MAREIVKFPEIVRFAIILIHPWIWGKTITIVKTYWKVFSSIPYPHLSLILPGWLRKEVEVCFSSSFYLLLPPSWPSSIARAGAEYPPQQEICQSWESKGRIWEKKGKNWEKMEKEEKSGRKGKNRNGSFTLPLLTERASYATVLTPPHTTCICHCSRTE